MAYISNYVKFAKYSVNSWHTWNDYKESVWNFLTDIDYRLLIYIYIVFTGGFFEVTVENWPEWDLNPRPLTYIYMSGT